MQTDRQTAWATPSSVTPRMQAENSQGTEFTPRAMRLSQLQIVRNNRHVLPHADITLTAKRLTNRRIQALIALFSRPWQSTILNCESFRAVVVGRYLFCRRASNGRIHTAAAFSSFSSSHRGHVSRMPNDDSPSARIIKIRQTIARFRCESILEDRAT